MSPSGERVTSVIRRFVQQSPSSTYMGFMLTVYAHVGSPKVMQIPLTSFDKNFDLNPLVAESWSQSDDGPTSTRRTFAASSSTAGVTAGTT